jgi:putative heme-binding domain-containing protein
VKKIYDCISYAYVSRLIWILLLQTTHAALIAQDTTWTLQPVPNAWRSIPSGKLAPIDGYSWYRALVQLPESWQGDSIALYVEPLDDARASYINGMTVGVNGTFPPQFRSGLGERGRYQVAETALRFGQVNTIAIRVYQSDPRPNFSVAPPVLLNETDMEAIRLEGSWQYRPGDDIAWAKATPSDFGFATTETDSQAEAATKGLFLRVDSVDDIDRYVSRREGDTDPLSPRVAEEHFQTPPDLQAQLVLGEPDIAQPLFMTWDERGRMWVIEYRQYPEPAGLTMLSRDVFLRSVYDKVPPPPPHHFKGKDRITIHEDTNGDGIYDSHKTFVDELSLASSVAIGRGGVFVTNAPYLLFYPDRNQDDVPDGDPEVLLEGFGIEDSHSVINSLRFGPDGWLYGAQGSTVSAAVRQPGSETPPIRTVGQQIWRYHPERKIFEVFAEGGGNTFGCEIDSKGRVYSGHNGGDTRGFHYVQGGYYRKGFGKHGPLSNPFAFGFFENIKHHSVARFTHNFIVYEDHLLPDRYRGKLFGIEPLQGQVVLSNIEPFQSSFETKDVERVLKTDDPWFRPVDIKVGPDGCVYVADMYEQRIDHSSHYAGRVDRTNGRIYRLKPKELAASQSIDYSKLSDLELLDLLNHPARWHRQTAIRLLGDRSQIGLQPTILDRLHEATGQLALELLWALQASGGVDTPVGESLLNHDDEFVRAWTVRVLTDSGRMEAAAATVAIALAATDPSIEVRKQLASSAKRLPAAVAIPMIAGLLTRDEDSDDIHQPLLIWWALESHVATLDASQIVQAVLSNQGMWQRPLVANTVLERLMKRYAISGRREDLLSAAKLLSAAPDKRTAEILLKGFEEAFQGRSLASIPSELANAIAASGGGSLGLRLRQGLTEAISESIEKVQNAGTKGSEKKQLIEIFGQTANPELLPVLLKLLETEKDSTVSASVLNALQSYDDPSIANAVISNFAAFKNDALLAAESLLSSRPQWTISLLRAIDEKQIAASQISADSVRKMMLHTDPTISDLIKKHWGEVAGASTSEMLSEIARINEIIRTGTGNPKQGKVQFTTHCGRCHRLFDEGGGIGPDLTPFARDNTERMLTNIINPNLEIREGFENYLIVTADGRVLTGFLADKDEQVVIVRGADGQNSIVQQEDIETMKAVPQSVMPEGTLKSLNEQQLRDLFAYLRSSQPVN